LYTTPEDRKECEGFDREEHQRENRKIVVKARGQDDRSRNSGIDGQHRHQPFHLGEILFVNVLQAPKRDETRHRPFALDRKRGIRVVSKHSMHQEEGCREGPNRVGRGGCGEGTEDGCEGNEREEDE
jgi:hypothetical protein